MSFLRFVLAAAAAAYLSGPAYSQSSVRPPAMNIPPLGEGVLRDQVDKIKGVKRLPVNGLSIVETTDGSVFLLSDNGRFAVIGGRWVDVWEGKNISGIADSVSLDKINFARMGINVDEFSPYVIGSGPKNVLVFVDPAMDETRAVVRQMAPLGKQYTFKVVLLPLNGGPAGAAARRLQCSPDRGLSLNALINGGLESLPVPKPDCDVSPSPEGNDRLERPGHSLGPVFHPSRLHDGNAALQGRRAGRRAPRSTVITRAPLLAVAALVLAGCNTLGQSKFDCPKNTEGAACLSAREIYERTHVADRVGATYKQGKEVQPDEAQPTNAAGTQVAVASARSSYRPPLPEVDTPLPVRTPAKVMRIRVFPWEDNSRDLHTGGYVYTEVEGRTWTIGEDQVSRVQANVISPLVPPSRATGATNLSPLNVTATQGPTTSVGRQIPPALMGQGGRPGQGQPALPIPGQGQPAPLNSPK